MACWRCECGYKNCDVEECQNPKCIKKAQKLKDLQQNLAGLGRITTMEKSLDSASDSDYKGFINDRI